MKPYAVVDEHGQFRRWYTLGLSIGNIDPPEEYQKAREDERQAWKALFQAEQRFMEETGNNRMCFECERLGNGCSGEKDKTYTACAMKVVKESEERKEVKRCHEQISKLNVDGS